MRSDPIVKRRRLGVTLIELLVVVALIGVLVGLVLVAVQASRAASWRLSCMNNLRQVGTGLQAHQTTHGIFPPQTKPPGGSLGSTFSYQGISWHTYLLPFIEQTALWDSAKIAYETNPDPWSVPHHGPMQAVVPAYVCPADRRLNAALVDADGTTAAYCSYVGMTGYLLNLKSGIFGRSRGVTPGEISDGLSQTIAVGERPPPASLSMGWWYTTHKFPNLSAANDNEVAADTGTSVYDSKTCGGEKLNWPGQGLMNGIYSFTPGSLGNECDKYHYWSLHPGGANFLFADGSVRFLPYSARFVLRHHATIAGGEPPSPW